ncbi:MAG TPA: hypothetical protein VK129_06000 [Terriglobales bacterium]|nr:hypothetical protein [Terriglobales bacterium]
MLEAEDTPAGLDAISRADSLKLSVEDAKPFIIVKAVSSFKFEKAVSSF